MSVMNKSQKGSTSTLKPFNFLRDIAEDDKQADCSPVPMVQQSSSDKLIVKNKENQPSLNLE